MWIYAILIVGFQLLMWVGVEMLLPENKLYKRFWGVNATVFLFYSAFVIFGKSHILGLNKFDAPAWVYIYFLSFSQTLLAGLIALLVRTVTILSSLLK